LKFNNGGATGYLRFFSNDFSVAPNINGRAMHAGGFAGDKRRAPESTTSGRDRAFNRMFCHFLLSLLHFNQLKFIP
jgi:hypothetical protein